MPSKVSKSPEPHYTISVRWQNFRCFPDTDWIEIRPLTILIGPNNSGKTSFIAPLLLMKQTLEFAETAIPLMTKGSLIDAGSFADVISRHNASLPLHLSLRYHHHEPDKSKKPPKLGSLPPGEFSVTFTSTKELPPNDFQLSAYKVFDLIGRPYLSRDRLSNNRFSLHFFPPQKLTGDIREFILEDKPRDFLFTDRPINRFVRRKMEKIEQREKKRQTPSRQSVAEHISVGKGASLYLSIVSIVESEVRSFLRNSTFIGPLREATKRIYELSGETPKNVGVKGDFTPEIIARGLYPQHKAWFRKWTDAFEFGGTVEPNMGPNDTFSLEVIRSRNGKKTSANLADMGFGLSQVLPLIVQIAYLQKDGLLVTEQPEIHLNPKLQCTLADLFVDAVKDRKKVLVETHSEHFLLRLRRLVAEGKISADKVALYFVEKKGTNSTIRSIPILPNGHIPPEEWPQGFFEDSLREALGLAANQMPEE